MVSFVLLIPLIYTERLGMGWIQSSVSFNRPTPPPVHPTVIHTTTKRSTRVWNTPSSSTHLRPVLDLLNDPAEPMPTPDCPGCVSGGPTVSNVFSPIGTNTHVLPPPPKPQPKVEAKKPADPPPAAINVSKGAQEAKIIRRVIPAYPSLARISRVQGTVRLQGIINTDGRIERLQVISGHPLLVQAAVEAVKQWLYRPTLLNGQPVEVIAPIDVNFILSN